MRGVPLPTASRRVSCSVSIGTLAGHSDVRVALSRALCRNHPTTNMSVAVLSYR